MIKEKIKDPVSNCCSQGKEAIYYFKNRKEYYLAYEGEDWWIITKYCPWCGKRLDVEKTEEFKSYEN